MCCYAKRRHQLSSVTVDSIGVSIISLTALFPYRTKQNCSDSGHWIEPAGSAEWARLLRGWLLLSLPFSSSFCK